ncbi:MAG: class I SAM-dependent methyltransferase [Chthoniobacterales bacterium]
MTVQCTGCDSEFSVCEGVPVFTFDQPRNLTQHTSNPVGAPFDRILEAGRDFVLNIGAGGTRQRYPNCIEFERSIFRHTDVVGDAHHLPFVDAVFDRVFAFNVFEHLREPTQAAAEILRVLKPGGSVAIHTAFLQALHEAPNHFYNGTEFGVRNWFAGFEIEKCDVSGNFGPGVMLGFLLNSVVEAARDGGASEAEIDALRKTTLGDWAQYWSAQGAPPQPFYTLQSLPQDLQKRVSAGFELIGRKPR